MSLLKLGRHFSELLIKDMAEGGKYFCHLLHSFLSPLPQISASFQKSKATVHRAVAQEQHSQGADFRGAQICLDTGPGTAAVLFLTVSGLWGCRYGAWALCNLGGEFCHSRLLKTQFSQTPVVPVSPHQAEEYAPSIFILLHEGRRAQTFLNP